jgi:hypothetical protein
MRTTTIGILAASALALTSCGGSGTTFANKPRPASPVNLTVYVNDSRVSVSPTSVGAGPVVFIVTNQASHAQSLSISAAGQSQPLASTAPINPQATTQLAVNFRPGQYTIATAPKSTTDASLANPPAIQPASLHIGSPRPSSSNDLLQP